MRILRVVALRSTSGAYGGPADTALNQSELISDRVEAVTLLSGVVASDLPPADATAIKTVEVTVRPLLRAMPIASLGSFSILRHVWLETSTHDVTHISFAREIIPLWATFSAIVQRKPLVLQPHGMLTARTGIKQRVLDVITKPLFRRADLVVALTSHEHQALSRWIAHGEPQTVAIGNPPLREARDASAQVASTESTREALFLARLEPRKRVVDFAQAATLAAERRLDITFAIVGPDQGDLETISQHLRTSRNLRYEGALPSTEVVDRLLQTTVFVLPSFREPWGNVLVTALALGIPVVITESAALADLVRQYRAGRVVPDGSPEHIVEALEDLINSPINLEKARSGALKISRDLLSSRATTAKLMDSYKRALASKRSA